MGREKFGELSGMAHGDVGDMMGKSIEDATKNLDRYSGAADVMKQQGNQAAMQARQRSGQLGTQTAGQESQIAQRASQGAATQRFAEEQASQKTYRQMASVLRNNAASMEQGFGAQQLATVKELSSLDMPKGGGMK